MILRAIGLRAGAFVGGLVWLAISCGLAGLILRVLLPVGWANEHLDIALALWGVTTMAVAVALFLIAEKVIRLRRTGGRK
jgi:hypothetical protein